MSPPNPSKTPALADWNLPSGPFSEYFWINRTKIPPLYGYHVEFSVNTAELFAIIGKLAYQLEFSSQITWVWMAPILVAYKQLDPNKLTRLTQSVVEEKSSENRFKTVNSFLKLPTLIYGYYSFSLFICRIHPGKYGMVRSFSISVKCGSYFEKTSSIPRTMIFSSRSTAIS